MNEHENPDSGPPAPAPSTRRPGRVWRILVVDDSAVCLDATAMMLEEAGFQATMVDSPFGLSSALTRVRPDLVLVDVAMPGLSGDKLVEITMRNRVNRPPLIVLYSDRPEGELRVLAHECGAAGAIRKTPDARVLVREIVRYLRA